MDIQVVENLNSVETPKTDTYYLVKNGDAYNNFLWCQDPVSNEFNWCSISSKPKSDITLKNLLDLIITDSIHDSKDFNVSLVFSGWKNLEGCDEYNICYNEKIWSSNVEKYLNHRVEKFMMLNDKEIRIWLYKE